MSFAQVIGSQLETHCKSVDVHQFLHPTKHGIFLRPGIRSVQNN